MPSRFLGPTQIFGSAVTVLLVIAMPLGFAQDAQDNASKSASTVQKAPEPSKSLPASAKTQVKPAAKTVYTNDNLPNAVSGFADSSLERINNCDRNCFDQVRRLARVDSDSPSWRRDVLHGIDAARKDAEWQKVLRDLAAAQEHVCALSEQKRLDLERVADPANVTPGELTIDEKYDVKFKEAQTSLQTVYTRQREVQEKFSANVFSFQFSQIQVSRVQNNPCLQRWNGFDP